MARRVYLTIGFLLAAVGVVHTFVQAGQDTPQAKPKHAIKEVMQGAHVAPQGEQSLLLRVAAGNASPEEQQQLLDLYISLAENEPPRGELAAFQAKTRPIIIAAAKVVVGREGAGAELRKAVNCAACHREHKPPTQ
jgi:hypothetical protein